ncbi:DNA mismatch repair protein MSH6 [Tanacetum coccineum]
MLEMNAWRWWVEIKGLIPPLARRLLSHLWPVILVHIAEATYRSPAYSEEESRGVIYAVKGIALSHLLPPKRLRMIMGLCWWFATGGFTLEALIRGSEVESLSVLMLPIMMRGSASAPDRSTLPLEQRVSIALLRVIAWGRWFTTHGMKLLVVKCLNSIMSPWRLSACFWSCYRERECLEGIRRGIEQAGWPTEVPATTLVPENVILGLESEGQIDASSGDGLLSFQLVMEARECVFMERIAKSAAVYIPQELLYLVAGDGCDSLCLDPFGEIIDGNRFKTWTLLVPSGKVSLPDIQAVFANVSGDRVISAGFQAQISCFVFSKGTFSSLDLFTVNVDPSGPCGCRSAIQCQFLGMTLSSRTLRAPSNGEFQHYVVTRYGKLDFSILPGLPSYCIVLGMVTDDHEVHHGLWVVLAPIYTKDVVILYISSTDLGILSYRRLINPGADRDVSSVFLFAWGLRRETIGTCGCVRDGFGTTFSVPFLGSVRADGVLDIRVVRFLAVFTPREQDKVQISRNFVGANVGLACGILLKLLLFYFRERKDANKRSPEDENYDPRTLYLPPTFLKSLSGGQMGKFYELFEMDAHVGTKELDLQYMKRFISESIHQFGSLNESITCATKDGLPESLSELMASGKVGSYAISALGGTLFYLKKAFLDESLLRFAKFELLPCSGFSDLTKRPCMILDATALENLEVFENSVNGDSKGTLYDQLNRCVTAFGKRLIKSWLARPLYDVDSIRERQEAVSGVKGVNLPHTLGFRKELAMLPDIERLLARVFSCSEANGRNASKVVLYEDASKKQLQEFILVLSGFELIINACSSLGVILEYTDSSLLHRLLTPGKDLPDVNAVLRHFKIVVTDIELNLTKHLMEQRKLIGDSLVNYVSIGKDSYLLEVPKSLCGSLPSDYELQSSKKNPNDVCIGGSDHANFIILTGPNMGGKSTLLRQVCLAVILAQMGADVPAESFKMSPVDRIFVRMGAKDHIMAGQSTFLTELLETASMLSSATHSSLVALDELGRGTSTSDGQAIAASVLEYLVNKVQCRGLFSTHYHHLALDYQQIPKVSLCHMACRVGDGVGGLEEVTFLYKLTLGACPKSYGVNVARLAGLPDNVLQKAATKSEEFETMYGKNRNRSNPTNKHWKDEMMVILQSLSNCLVDTRCSSSADGIFELQNRAKILYGQK